MLKNEVEREVLAIVLLVIIIVSVLGTWAVINVLDHKQVQYVDNYQAGAQVSLYILPTEPTTTSSGDDTS